MDKRYQVFVSSTYEDLIEERSEVMQALLELNCMPAGMELFPAANEEQWNWITKVIDESDYYIVVIGGRYGTVHEKTGLSYTEMEYRYALDAGKPVIAFLHEDPSNLAARRCENNEEKRDKLSDFRTFVQKRLCKHWSNAHDLGAKVSRSLTQLIRHQPAVGWVRGNLADQNRAEEMLKMRKRIEELESQLRELGNYGPEGIEDLSRGNDEFLIGFVYETKRPKINRAGLTYWVRGDEYHHETCATWDGVFSIIAPKMLAPCDRHEIIREMDQCLWPVAREDVKRRGTDERVQQVRIHEGTMEAIKLQFRALGLITIEYGEYRKERWAMTPYGERHAVRLLAVHRTTLVAESINEEP
jgi:Domain of unknown function (DUF4062)